MPAAGARAVGSVAWIAAEKENAMHLMEQEMEEVEFPVRHEMEWLNEHMAEIFSKNQFNLTEIFKTPGKLRGKTPRTVRKRNVDEARVPLSDIFSSNHQIKSTAKPDYMTEQPTVGAASTLKEKERSQKTAVNPKLNSFSTYNTDSGYHGLPDYDEVVLPGMQAEAESSTKSVDTQSFDTQPMDTQPIEDTQVMEMQGVKDIESDTHHAKSPSVDRRTTEGSFHSAQENIHLRGETVEPMETDEDQEMRPDEDTPRPTSKASQPPRAQSKSPVKLPGALLEAQPKAQPAVQPEAQAERFPVAETKEKNDGGTVPDNQFDDIGSPSDSSTPDRPLVRKSSLSFAPLPAREPLTTKKSMGARISQTSHVDIPKLNNAGGPSYFSSQMTGQKTARTQPGDSDGLKLEDDKMDFDGKADSLDDSDMDLETAKLHHKSSTQRLQEKINQLGKFQPSRANKSIPAVSHMAAPQVSYPELPSGKQAPPTHESRITPTPEPSQTGDGDWIKPPGSPYRANIPKSYTTDIMEQIVGDETVGKLEKGKLDRTDTFHDLSDKRSPLTTSPGFRVLGHQKSASTSTPSSPQRLGTRERTLPVSSLAVESTTPPVSPKRYDGALSMSKSKLQSLMKTAKGLFTSSAGISAAAKLETLSSSPTASRSQPHLANYAEDRFSPSPQKQPVRERDATESEEKGKKPEASLKQRQEDFPEISRGQEKTTTLPEVQPRQEKAQEKVFADRDGRETTPAPNRASPRKIQRPQTQTYKEPETYLEPEHKFPLPPTSHQLTQPIKPNDRRPVRPTRETVQKPKPQPVSIRVGSTLSRMPLSATTSTTSLSSSVQEPNAAPTPASVPKQPTLTKKASNSSLQTASSTSSFKSSVSSQTQRKAQLAAEKKKQEEREARRKEDQKRELERKRVTQQQEEARRQEAKSRAETEKRERLADDPKKSAQRQAIEQRRLENARRLERQGSQPPNPANDLGSILHQEKTNVQSSQRADMGPSRPPSRLGSVQPFSRSINQPSANPAKLAKRVLDEETQPRPAAPNHATYQVSESKRRKTEDEHNPPPSVRPTMAPPIRQSNIRKEPVKPQIFGHGYAPAPPPAAHPQTGASLYKNAPAGSHHVQQAPVGPPHRPGHPIDMAKYTNGKIPFADAPNPSHASSTAHKTPNQGSQRVAAKSSPQYPNGENIHLPEIPTDSEDEDSDAEMLPVPKWAQAKELETILREQEGRETESIFGPIAPFSLEETFKADKKIKKFRERTSSANWAGPDGLTQDEVRRDNAERQRLRMNGGWQFNGS